MNHEPYNRPLYQFECLAVEHLLQAVQYRNQTKCANGDADQQSACAHNDLNGRALSMAVTDAMLYQHTVALNAVMAATNQLVAVQRATLPQTYTMKMLHDAYPGMGEQRIREQLVIIGGWPADAAPGRTTIIPLETKLELDAFINGRHPLCAKQVQLRTRSSRGPMRRIPQLPSPAAVA